MKKRLLRITPVEELPKNIRTPSQSHDLVKIFDEFMGMSCKFAKVHIDRDDYACIHKCADSFRSAVLNYKYPINITIRQGDLYLVKKDII